jgi:hypothetical protein
MNATNSVAAELWREAVHVMCKMWSEILASFDSNILNQFNFDINSDVV